MKHKKPHTRPTDRRAHAQRRQHAAAPPRDDGAHANAGARDDERRAVRRPPRIHDEQHASRHPAREHDEQRASRRPSRINDEQHPPRHASRGHDEQRASRQSSREHVEGRAAQHPSREREEEDFSRARGEQIYGVLPVLEALRAGARPVERITVAEGAHESRLQELFELARAARIPVRRAPRAELQRVAPGVNHQGVVASVAAAHYRAAEELVDSLAARVGSDEPPLALVLDGVEDPRNLGAIIRTAECAGAHGVFVPERRSAGLTETVAKTAAGALEYVPVARAGNLVRLVEELKARGVWTVGTASDAGVVYTDWDWTAPCALLLGGEGQGLRRLVRERCDALVRVPLLGRIESLNVSVAAGVVLFEAVRQRTAAKAAAYKVTPNTDESADE